jgi:hypothetical protein
MPKYSNDPPTKEEQKATKEKMKRYLAQEKKAAAQSLTQAKRAVAQKKTEAEKAEARKQLAEAKEGVAQYKLQRNFLKTAEATGKALAKARELRMKNEESVKAQKATKKAFVMMLEYRQSSDQYKRERQEREMKEKK